MKDVEAVKIINYNRKCVKKIKKWVEKEKDDNKRMDLIEYYLHFCVNNVTGVYSDPWIEKKIIEYSSKLDFDINADVIHDTVLIVMTAVSSIGGHTALANNWIQFDKDKKYSVILTESSNHCVPKFLEESVKESGGNIFYLNSSDNVSKAKELLNIAQKFEYVILNIHMYDVVPIIAFGHRNWKRPVCFYNHADFLFSIGISVSDMVFSMNEYDHNRTINNRGAVCSKILPVPQSKKIYKKSDKSKNELKRQLSKEYGFNADSKIILTMGSDFKFVRTEHYDFEKFVEHVLQLSPANTYFFIIGADPNKKIWDIMRKNTHNHARALGIVKREIVSDWMKIADAYVTSFPMTSAGSAEARENNVPNFRFTPTGRANEYVPKEEIYDSIDELAVAVANNIKLKNTNCYELPLNAKLARDPEQWCRRLDDLLKSVNKHEVHNFKNVPILEEQEIINVQLLQGNSYPYGRSRILGWKKMIKIILIKCKQKCMYKVFNHFN